MTSMSVQTFMQIAPRLPSDTSVLIRGNHGIGKSQLGRQFARLVQKDLKLDNYPVIDRRLSQVSEGDIIGLPSTDGETTRFNPPDWYKKACDEPVFLFLDELNRATPEVMQAAFQIVLDRELNGWKLHPQTRVMSAVNSAANYNVNEIDPALLDRFWVIDLEPSVEDWVAWAKLPKEEFGGGLSTSTIDFVIHNEKFLDPPKNVDPGTVHPSRRSYERLNNALVGAGLMETPNDASFYAVSVGYIGTEAAIAFTAFCKQLDAVITGEEIVENFKGSKKRLSKLGQERLLAAMDKVAEYVVKLDKLSDPQGENVKAFMNLLPMELRISFWTKLTQAGVEKIDLVKSVHKHCVSTILEVFEVPLGEAGVGIMPKIPGLFKEAAKK